MVLVELESGGTATDLSLVGRWTRLRVKSLGTDLAVLDGGRAALRHILLHDRLRLDRIREVLRVFLLNSGVSTDGSLLRRTDTLLALAVSSISRAAGCDLVRSKPLRLLGGRNDAISLGKYCDETQRIFGLGLILVICFEKVLELHGTCSIFTLSSLTPDTAALADHLSDVILSEGVVHTSLLSDLLLLGEISLKIILCVIFELSVELLIFEF